jgi:hypothetical protein
MNHNEYRDALAALDLTQGAAARFFQVDERTSRRWATGEIPVPHAVALLFRVMIEEDISPARVYELAGLEEFEP